MAVVKPKPIVIQRGKQVIDKRTKIVLVAKKETAK